MIKQIIAAATLAATSFVASPALATPRNFDGHIQLVSAIQDAGVSVYINHLACSQGSYLGFYAGVERAIVICQEGGVAGGDEVAWTEEDLDTLRHEAQHFIQDCMVGSNYDHNLSSVYREPVEFALSVLGPERARRIAQAYIENGATEHVVILELEAFAVAALDDPLEQVGDIQRYCM